MLAPKQIFLYIRALLRPSGNHSNVAQNETLATLYLTETQLLWVLFWLMQHLKMKYRHTIRRCYLHNSKQQLDTTWILCIYPQNVIVRKGNASVSVIAMGRWEGRMGIWPTSLQPWAHTCPISCPSPWGLYFACEKNCRSDWAQPDVFIFNPLYKAFALWQAEVMNCFIQTTRLWNTF